MTMLSRLVDETFTISRFTVIGLLATATHAVVGSGAVVVGMPVLIANAVGFLVAWTVSFYGHYMFTFGQPNDMRVARTRFIVISLILFAISQLSVALLQTTHVLSAWIEPMIGAIVVPPASYVLYRLYVFAPDLNSAVLQSGPSVGGPAIVSPFRRGSAVFEIFDRLTWVHRILVPFLIYSLFFNLSALNPTNVSWLASGDLGQHFVGWTAFQHDAWRWPLGFSELVAFPHGAPLTATDSNPLVALPLKLLAPLLPAHFQFFGLWYLLCLLLSYNIVFNLLSWLSGRYWPSLFASVIAVASSFFFQRYGHDTLMAHWLIFASFSVFIRSNSDRRAIAKHAGILAMSIAVHPYFLPMTFSIAGMDTLRRSYWLYRRRQNRRDAMVFLVTRVTILLIPPLLVGWILGIFALQTVPHPVGHYSMDPFSWFNGQDYSMLLRGWEVHDGQYEGAQYLGIGGLIVFVVAAFLWLTGLAGPPERVRRSLPWLAPAMIYLFFVAISPIVYAFGVKLYSFHVQDWPVIGYVYSAFRSSGRFGWPIAYLILLTSLALWLTIRSRAIGPLLAGLALLQLIDISPVAERTRNSTAVKASLYEKLGHRDDWQRLIEGSDRVYASAGIDRPVLFELGLTAFPAGKPLNRFYFAQDLKTAAQAEAELAEHEQVLQGQFADGVLYVLDPAVVGNFLKRGDVALDRLRELDGLAVLPPTATPLDAPVPFPFHPRTDDQTLVQLVEECSDDCAVILSIKDDGMAALPLEFKELITSRGGTIATLPFRGSYAAAMLNGRIVAEARELKKDVELQVELFGHDVRVLSGGGFASSRSSIRVNGFELSPNARGMNIVRIEPAGISAVNAFDTHHDPSRALVP